MEGERDHTPAPGGHKGPPIGINLSDLTLSSFAALRIWLDGAARCFAALSMRVPTLVVKLPYRPLPDVPLSRFT